MAKTRILSFTLALVQLLSFGKYNLKKEHKIYPKIANEIECDVNVELLDNNVSKFVNKDGYIVYLRLDQETGKYKNISIFDDENIPSKQYGASQLDFKKRADALVKEPLILERLQKYFENIEFSDEEEALFAYKKYLYTLYKFGCGYAAAANFIFSIFEGHEKEFYDTFGYPMYTVDEHGYVDFNYEIAMMDFLEYSADKVWGKGSIINCFIKDIYDFRLENYIQSEEFTKKIPDNFDSWTDEEWESCHKFEETREAKFKELYDKWANARNIYIDFGILLDASFGEFGEYLKEHGINYIDSYMIEEPDELDTNDIVASDDFTLYKLNGKNKYGFKERLEWHYFYVTGIENGKIVVSSWGDKYIFDRKHAGETDKILIKTAE